MTILNLLLRTRLLRWAFLLFIIVVPLLGQNVFIVVIDGARYSETFLSESKYIPRIWNDLRQEGTIYTLCLNLDGTYTVPGHASIITGVWQKLPNDGSKRPTVPTIFEYFRKQMAEPKNSCFVVAGKRKLSVLTHSTDKNYGKKFGANLITTRLENDIQVWNKLNHVINKYHPKLVIVNFPEVDNAGHSGNYDKYLKSLRQVDSLIYLLWNKIQSDSIYKKNTVMFVTNDHGRHDDQHGNFKDHGCTCNGCSHIMLLAIGLQFPKNTIVSDTTYQIDIVPTIGEILGFNLPQLPGRSLLRKFKD